MAGLELKAQLIIDEQGACNGAIHKNCVMELGRGRAVRQR